MINPIIIETTQRGTAIPTIMAIFSMGGASLLSEVYPESGDEEVLVEIVAGFTYFVMLIE